MPPCSQTVPMDAVEALAHLGGTATHRQLLALATRGAIRHAVATGRLTREGRGRYALPTIAPARRIAHSLGGALSHTSAARHYCWPTLTTKEELHVTVPPERRVGQRPSGVVLHWAALSTTELFQQVTAPIRTVLDCAALPWPEALTVADSALRSGLEPIELIDAAEASQGRGRRRKCHLAQQADRRAENPFESALRAVLLEAGLTGWIPQYVITGEGIFVVADLALPLRRLAIEADGYATHGSRRSFSRDLRRHDDLAALGWRTLRFTWEQVRHDPQWVVAVVRNVLAQPPPDAG